MIRSETRRGKGVIMIVGNERGGILSSVFIIPVGVVVIISVFFLGYVVGKRQTANEQAGEKPPALPDVVSKYLPENEEFTFYKTLSDKGDKTVSIELKAKTATEAAAPAPTDRPAPPAAVAKQQAGRPQRAGGSQAPQTVRETGKQRFTIQIASYPERRMAEDEVRDMKRRGYAAFLVATEIPDKGTWFRVRVGSFSSKLSAEKLAAELKSKEGISSFITSE